MKRIKISLPQNRWSSLNTSFPANSSLVDQDELTGDTKNLSTDSKGVITKRQGGTEFITGLTNAKDQYEAVFADGTHHLLVMDNGTLKYTAGANSLTTVQTGYSAIGNMEFAMYLDRVYFGNGIDQPQVYDRTASYGGVAYSPVPKTKSMGAQAPTTTLTGAVGAAGSVPAGSYTYKVTFLYYDFEESNGGPASAAVSPGVPSQITLTAIPVGGYGVTARKIYRSGDGGLTYRLVQTIADNTTVAGTDNVATGTALIPTDNATPRNGKFYIQHLDRIWIAGISGDPSELDFSEAGLPDLFPAFNTIICNTADPITGIVVFNDRVVVMNRHSFGEILGTTTDTFRYSEVPGNIGCVDNRTIQVRTINGVPLLIWLSDKGFYAWNGGSMQYISDKIEDLVNVNIQQANQVRGQNAQSTQADFASGTADQGISLTYLPGGITLKGYTDGTNLTGNNPRRTIEDNQDWALGTQTADLQLLRSDNKMSTIPRVTFGGGLFTGDMTTSSGSFRLTTSTDFTGQSVVGGGNIPNSSPNYYSAYAQPVILPRAGTVTQFSMNTTWQTNALSPTAYTYRFKICRDDGDKPGFAAFTSSTFTAVWSSPPIVHTDTLMTAVSCAANEKVWVVLELDGTLGRSIVTARDSSTVAASNLRPKKYATGAWIDGGANLLRMNYTYACTPIAASGTWTSDAVDIYSVGAATCTAAFWPGSVFTSTFPSKSYLLQVQASPDNVVWTMVYQTSARSTPSPVGLSGLTGYRYFREYITLATSDNRSTDSVKGVALDFASPVDWVSEVIDTTSNCTSYTSLTSNITTPFGTSATVTIATSDDNITYTSYVTFGSHVVKRYAKIKVSLSSYVGTSNVPSVSSINFKWTVTASLQSYHIDTGSTPAGWDIFQASYLLSGGVVAFELRTAATEGGLSSATYISVSNGTFPAVPANRWAQWKVTLTSTDGNTPTVDSVTLNWFVTLTAGVRPASIFWDKSYYMSASEFGNTANNLLLEFDSDGFWRVHRGLNVATFSLFFNNPYYTDTALDKIIKFASADTDLGVAIELLAETKELDFGSSTAYKVLRWIKVVGVGTGAVYTFTYSVDGGNTYLPLVTNTGSTTVTTVNDGKVFTISLAPQWPNEIQGLTVKIKCVESTTATVELHELHFNVLVRQGDLLDA